MNKADLINSIEKAQRIFEEIKKKYKGIKAYLVFSSPLGQCEMTSNMQTILEEYPEMVQDSIHKKKASELIQNIRNLKQATDRTFAAKSKSDLNKEMDRTIKELVQISENLGVKDDVFIEIRFSALDYNIIDELRKDSLISLKYTPQTRASIRIVLGKISDFVHRPHECQFVR